MEDYILSHGSYLAIILIITLTGAGLPIPEEVPVVTAGVLSSSEVAKLNPWLAFGSCLLGALLGDSVMYGIGRFFGHAFLARHPWFARLLNEQHEKQMEELIERQGLKVFLLARFLVGVRAPVYLAAGAMRVRFAKFLLVDLVCATSVVGVFFWLSYSFGASMGPILRESQWALTGAVALIVLLGGSYLLVVRRYRKKLNLGPPKSTEETD